MRNLENKNILVITKSPWDATNAFGNTLSNFFGGWHEVRVSNIYCREGLPNNDVCHSYYNITESQLLKNMCSPRKIGRKFSHLDLKEKRQSQFDEKVILREKKILDFFRENRGTLFLIAREILWKLGGWRNKQLGGFLNENKADIIFAAVDDSIYLKNIILYCKKKTNAELILFFSDDVYHHKTYLPLQYLYQSVVRRSIKKCVKIAGKLYGASPLLSEKFEPYFGKQIEPLYKGCFFDCAVIKESISFPIKMVFAGNLFYGRWKILAMIADELEKINQGDIKIVQEIYTTTTITRILNAALNKERSSRVMGAVPYEKVKQVLANADIVLHVESFEKKQIKTTWLSFSTKIIDCMQSGRCMLAIGPASIASIQYVETVDGAVVVSDLSKLSKVLHDFVQNPEQIIKRAVKLNEFARRHHGVMLMQDKLKHDFSALIDKK